MDVLPTTKANTASSIRTVVEVSVLWRLGRILDAATNGACLSARNQPVGGYVPVW
jgi:hypothetical protein